MKPKNFAEANTRFTKPAAMTDGECGDLPAYNDGRQIVACWEMTTDEKLCAAFFGELWVGVFGQGLPPLWFMTRNPFTYDDAHTLPDEEVVENFMQRRIRQFLEIRFLSSDADSEIRFESPEEMSELLEEFLNFVFRRRKGGSK